MDLKLTDENLKKMLVIPVVILVVALLFLVVSYMQNGYFLKRGIDLEGGLQISVRHSEKISVNDFKAFLNEKFPENGQF